MTIVSACGFSVSVNTSGDQDASVPDAGPCQDLGATCAGDELRRCTVIGALPTSESCEWGCVDGPPPHCGEVVPGGALLPTDLVDNPMIESKTLDVADFDTDDGDIAIDESSARGAGSGVINGIDFFKRGNASVFRFRNLTLTGNTRAHGSNALAIVAFGTITIDGAFNMQGDCSGTNAGPGGFPGGARSANAPGTTGGKRGEDSFGGCSAGGGGSYGSLGGSGGSSNSEPARPAPGAVLANANITMLVGGGGGGGGGGESGSGSTDGGPGGGGGGAIQLFALQGIVINNAINAGGCGGSRGGSNDCGGGGGAGGAILLEGRTIMFGSGARLVVNGGGGGGANDGSAGSSGLATTARASGGAGASSGGDGGSGGAHVGLDGLAGQDDNDSPGGGGGGVGWMRFNTRSGSATITSGAVCSPDFTPSSTTSQGKLDVR